jgi:hypothetical protein
VAAVFVAIAAACTDEAATSGATALGSPKVSASLAPMSRFPALSQDQLITMSEPVQIRGAGRTPLEGRVFGSGDVGIVLAHMAGDQSQWFGLAGLLGDHGYRVLTFDRRGTCPDCELGCSGGQNDGQGWKDLSFLVERLRETGAGRS